MFPHIEGLVAAPVTAFAPDGSVTLDPIEEYAALLARNGVAGVFVNGTTGEGLSLTVDERLRLAARWVETAPTGFKVLIHVGHTSIAATETMARHAQDIGAFGFGTMAPIYFKPPTVARLVAHCAQEAAAAPNLPYYYYHIPSLTGVDFSMIEFLTKAEEAIPNLAGIKYTFENFMDLELCRRYRDGRYNILVGRDEMWLHAYAQGTRAAIGSTYNFMAPLYLEVARHIDAGDLPGASDLQYKAMRVIKVVLAAGGFIPAVKHILQRFGLELGGVRSPLHSLPAAAEQTLDAELDALDFADHQMQ
jgi:N-acetylneuraminate lyase